MIEESFTQSDSFFHRCDPRIKLIVAAILSFPLALSQNFHTALSGLFIALCLLIAARLDMKKVLKRLLLVNTFIGLLCLTLPLTYPGESLFAIGPLHLSVEGLNIAALITIKSNAIVILLIPLLATSSIADIGHGLRRLGLPNKFCLLLLFSYRYIFVIEKEYHRLVQALKLRCFSPATNLQTYRTFAHLFGMTLVRSWNRAERIKQAMLLRGFDGRFYSLKEQSIKKQDLAFLGAAVILSVGMAFMEIPL